MTKLFRCVSDIHNEFNAGNAHVPVPRLDGEENMVLIIAGDLGVADKPYTFDTLLENLAERHEQVIYLPGNHEFYHTSILRGDDKIRAVIKERQLDNVTYVGVDGDVIDFDTVTVIANPLFCDCNGADPLTMFDVKNAMNDFRTIRTGTADDPYKRKLDPADYVRLHMVAKSNIFYAVEQAHNEGRKVLVATHWGPSYQSVPDRFKGSTINGAYVSNLDIEIDMYKPEIMVHGHTHDSFDYQLSDTRVICNPHGYVGTADHNREFDPNLVVEL